MIPQFPAYPSMFVIVVGRTTRPNPAERVTESSFIMMLPGNGLSSFAFARLVKLMVGWGKSPN